MALRRRPFAARNGGVDVRLDPAFRTELRDVAGMTLELVEPGYDELLPSPDAVPEPQDEALLRLFPSAYSEHPDQAAEFRRLTDGELRAGKRSDATCLRDTAGDEHLEAAVAEAWLRALNDARLVLASRLGLATDDDADDLYAAAEDASEPVRAAVTGTYLRLGWIQESLIAVMD